MLNLPPAIVLIVCKVVFLGPPHPATGAEQTAWDTTDNVLHCRREVVPVEDEAVLQGAQPRPFTKEQCQASGIMLGVRWNEAHKSGKYRWFKSACATPVLRGNGKLGYDLPDCGTTRTKQTMICEDPSHI